MSLTQKQKMTEKNLAALMALNDESALLMQRMEDSSVRAGEKLDQEAPRERRSLAE